MNMHQKYFEQKLLPLLLLDFSPVNDRLWLDRLKVLTNKLFIFRGIHQLRLKLYNFMYQLRSINFILPKENLLVSY